MIIGSTPYSCTERTVSPGSNCNICRVFRSRATTPRLVTISHTYNPAPCSRHSCRYAALVTPAIGASTTGVATSIGPTRSPRPEPVEGPSTSSGNDGPSLVEGPRPEPVEGRFDKLTDRTRPEPVEG